MHVLPAIDVLQGKAVRLRQGRYDDVTVYADDPAAVAATFAPRVPMIHVVDLEGARAGRAMAGEVVRRIVETVAPAGAGVEVGGGIRSIDVAAAYLDVGVARVVLGTAAVRDPAFVRAAATRWPGRVVVALDAKDGKVALEGWEEVSARTAIEVARELAGLPIAAILYTDVARDGMQVGPNLTATADLAAAAPCPVLASGGVGTLDHLRALAKIPNVAGAVVGRALYERAFSLDEAIAAAAEPRA